MSHARWPPRINRADRSRGTTTVLTCCSAATTAVIAVVVIVVVASQCLWYYRPSSVRGHPSSYARRHGDRTLATPTAPERAFHSRNAQHENNNNIIIITIIFVRFARRHVRLHRRGRLLLVVHYCRGQTRPERRGPSDGDCRLARRLVRRPYAFARLRHSGRWFFVLQRAVHHRGCLPVVQHRRKSPRSKYVFIIYTYT